MVLREFEQVISLIQGNARMTQNELNRPFSILSVPWEGNFSTFDPELLSVASDRYGSFNLGNLKDLSLVESTHTEQFRRLMADMTSGVETCHKSCEYFGKRKGATAATSSGNTAPSPPAKPTPAASAPRSPRKCCKKKDPQASNPSFLDAIHRHLLLMPLQANAACSFLPPVGGGDPIVKKKVERPKGLIGIAPTGHRFRGGSALPQLQAVFHRRFQRPQQLSVQAFLKFSDGSNRKVADEQLQPPVGTGRMFGPFQQVPGKSISQVNFRIGANKDPQSHWIQLPDLRSGLPLIAQRLLSPLLRVEPSCELHP